MDDCWMINIKAPAGLNVEQGEPDLEGFQARPGFIFTTRPQSWYCSSVHRSIY
jgi:hypothetical protein